MSWWNAVGNFLTGGLLGAVQGVTKVVGSAISAVTDIFSGSSSTTQAAASRQSDPSSALTYSSGVNGLSKPNMPKAPGANASDDEKQAYQNQLMQYQSEMQTYNQMVSMLTNIQQTEHDTRKAVINNYRV